MALVVSALTVSALRLPSLSSPRLVQPPPPKGFTWAADVRELEGRVVEINRMVGGRSTGRGKTWCTVASSTEEIEDEVAYVQQELGKQNTEGLGTTALVHPDAAITCAENEQIQSLVLAARRRADAAVMRPPTPSVPMSLPRAFAVVLAKLVMAKLLLVKLLGVELLSVALDAVARIVVACMGRLARMRLAMARPLRCADEMRDALLPADAILSLNVRPRTAGRYSAPAYYPLELLTAPATPATPA